MVEEYKYDTKDIGIYRPIKLVPEFAEQGNIGALEKTIKDLGKNIGVRDKDLKDVAALFANPQNLENTIKIFSGKYNKAFNSQKLSDLRSFYGDYFKEFYTEENLPKVDEVFNSEEVYGDIIEKYNDAVTSTKLQSEKYKGQKEQAEKDVKELSKIVLPINSFEDFELDTLRKPANKESLKKILNSLYEEKKESE